MNCEHCQADLPAYLSGQLPAAEQAALTAHLTGCADCRRERQATARTWELLGRVPTPEPGPLLRPAFYAMLADYQATLEEPAPARPTHPLPRLRQWWREQPAWRPRPRFAQRLAYGLALLGAGAVGGYWLSAATNQRPATTAGADRQQVAALAAQVGELRQVLLLSLIQNPSATERLRAVGYTKELREGPGRPPARVVAALLSTLHHDANVNVRLAALEALVPLAPDDPAVRLGLVRALARQESPLVQSALADVMVQLQERRSVGPLRALLRRADLNELVKRKIEQSIQALSSGPPAASSPSSTPARHDQTQHLAQPEPAAALTI